MYKAGSEKGVTDTLCRLEREDIQVHKCRQWHGTIIEGVQISSILVITGSIATVQEAST